MAAAYGHGRGDTGALRSDDAAPLLENDFLASSFDLNHVDLDSFDGDNAESSNPLSSILAKQVQSTKQAGRKARARAIDLSATRRQEVKSAGKDALKHGVFIAADVAVPGLGTAMGGVDGIKTIRDKRKEGRGEKKQSAKQATMFAMGFIPVVGPFVSMSEDVFNAARSTFTPARRRTKKKVEAAKKLVRDSTIALGKIPSLYQQVTHGDASEKEKAEWTNRLDKAESRLLQSIEDAQAWLDKKADHGTLPLLAEDDVLDEAEDYTDEVS